VPAEARLDDEALAGRLRTGARLRRPPHARVAWCADGDHLLVFANGERWQLPAGLASVAARCAGAAAFGWGELEAAVTTPAALALLADLTASGSLEWVDGGIEDTRE
jgi:ribosomal protein L16 Arg81 hydroxylase